MNNQVGLIIRKHRIKMGLTQDELAQGICSTQHVFRLEKGIRLPSLYLYLEMSSKLGDNLITDLLGLIDSDSD